MDDRNTKIDERTGLPKIILDLCGGTGSWSKPYSDAGYDVRIITLPDNDVRTYAPPKNVYGILAAPPCTEFSVLNCKAEQRIRNEADGLEIVSACLWIVKKCKASGSLRFHAIENPVGFLRKHLGKPPFTFQPWYFGDPWTKHTDVWGSYNLPETAFNNWDDVPKLPLYTRPNRGKPNFAYLHKSAWSLIPQLQYHKPASDAEFRAMTPPGFAQAFFKANQ